MYSDQFFQKLPFVKYKVLNFIFTILVYICMKYLMILQNIYSTTLTQISSCNENCTLSLPINVHYRKAHIPLSAFTNGDHALVISTPRDVLDRTSDRLELILEDVFLVHGIPDANLAGRV